MMKFLLLQMTSIFLFNTASVLAREPDPGKRVQRLAFGSCAQQDKPQPIWNAVLQSHPDLFIFTGDNIYADTTSMVFMKEQYNKLARVVGYQQLMRSMPLIAIWDDHDYGVNDGGSDFSFKEKSKELFLDFFEIPKNAPQRQRDGLYASYLLGPTGQTVQVILLDTRFFRDPLVSSGKYHQYGPVLDPSQTILGKEQWRWLEEELRKPAELRFIVSSIQVIAEEQPFEKWNNFPYERKKLFRLIKNTKANGVIFLSGDRHFSEISVIDGGAGYPLYDFTSSSLNDSYVQSDYPELNKHRLVAITKKNNFGLVSIDWKSPKPKIQLEIRDENGAACFTHEMTVNSLK